MCLHIKNHKYLKLPCIGYFAPLSIGYVTILQVRSEDGRRTPSWLAVDSKHGLISGVPQKQDLGAHTFTVTAHGNTQGLTATDSFTVEVIF